MVIKFSKKFDKQYLKLGKWYKEKFKSRLKTFSKDPYNIALNNHQLKWAMSQYRSINITWDIRALYYEQGDEITIFALIGSHSELY
jgi:mRNA-degrading endonuclease YafQ of YafQ-DinJ toxin-antitoxin module